MTQEPQDIFNALEGKWTLERRITAPAATATGIAAFTRGAAPDTLDYREEGVLRLATGHENPFHRSYLYKLEQGTIAIYFNDGASRGRLFQQLDMRGPRAAGFHRCAPDDYASGYDFAKDTFTVTHTVRGPRKDYTSVTVYRRA